MTLSLLFAAVSFAVACGGSAAKKPTVVVLKVKGKNGSQVSEAIVKLLDAQGEYRLLSRGTYDATAKELKATRVKSSNVRKVASKIGAQVVVTGRLRRVRKREYRLQVDVRDGRTGRRVERFKLRLKGRELNSRSRKELNVELIQAMAAVDLEGGLDDEERGAMVAEDSAQKKKQKKKEKKDRDEPRAKKEKKKSKKQLRAEREAAEQEREAAAEEEKRLARERKAQDKERRKEEEREARLQAKEEARQLEEETKRREAEEKKRKEREAKAAAARAKKKEEAEERRRKKEQAELDKVTKPKTKDDGQVIDDETPGGI